MRPCVLMGDLGLFELKRKQRGGKKRQHQLARWREGRKEGKAHGSPLDLSEGAGLCRHRRGEKKKGESDRQGVLSEGKGEREKKEATFQQSYFPPFMRHGKE